MDIGEKEVEAILCNLCELYKVERKKLSATKLNHCGDARVSCLPIAKKSSIRYHETRLSFRISCHIQRKS
ncbi:hypothetical protein KIN20_007399 [Parelaphostrongylus tenuis]|uniref:Uncharacterized protein n=1 Tax=Parelaphostrongylus tenuis TaxID=148309 RepID=A0AAD5QGU9_PARTN|nr:hypothetical protein KIN20_007399 [Parelaphostrongylus tenuis]